jgi:hypothetical protein
VARVPFAINAYQSDSLPLSAQNLINWYAEGQPPDAKAPIAVFGTPGLSLFGTAGGGPLRGAECFQNLHCSVSGNEFYTTDEYGTSTLRGTVGGGSQPVMMSGSGTQLVLLSGHTDADGYIWNGTTLSKITDASFYGARDVTFIDTYHAFIRPNTGQFYLSDPGDASTFDALNIATAEGASDDLIATENNHLDLWLMGKASIEIWYNAGSGNPPFNRVENAFIERGCRSEHTVVKEDNSLFWLGDDLVVYRNEGYIPKRISTHPIEQAIKTYAAPNEATAWSYTQGGHKFYVLNFEEATWVYDIATGLWHQRQSYTPTGTSLGRWRAAFGIPCFNKTIVGDYENGNLYTLDTAVYTENGTAIQRSATSAPIHGGGKRVRMPSLQIEMETGVGLTTGQGSDPQIALSWSDDEGRTWSNEHWRSMGAKGKGKTRIVWRKLGKFRSRIYRLTQSDPVKSVIIAADAELSA